MLKEEIELVEKLARKIAREEVGKLKAELFASDTPLEAPASGSPANHDED